MSAWPTLTPEKAGKLIDQAEDAALIAERLAGRVTVYPGGGVPANKLREAAKLIDEARAWMAEVAA